MHIQDFCKVVYSLQEQIQANNTQNSQQSLHNPREQLQKLLVFAGCRETLKMNDFFLNILRIKTEKEQQKINEIKHMMEQADVLIQWLRVIEGIIYCGSSPYVDDIMKYKKHFTQMCDGDDCVTFGAIGTFLYSILSPELSPERLPPIGLIIAGWYIPKFKGCRNCHMPPQMCLSIVEEFSRISNIPERQVVDIINRCLSTCKEQQKGRLNENHRDVIEVELLCQKYIEKHRQDILGILSLVPSLKNVYKTYKKWYKSPEKQGPNPLSSLLQGDEIRWGEKIQVFIKQMNLSAETVKRLSERTCLRSDRNIDDYDYFLLNINEKGEAVVVGKSRRYILDDFNCPAHFGKVVGKVGV